MIIIKENLHMPNFRRKSHELRLSGRVARFNLDKVSPAKANRP
jgi:hypothetical protein